MEINCIAGSITCTGHLLLKTGNYKQRRVQLVTNSYTEQVTNLQRVKQTCVLQVKCIHLSLWTRGIQFFLMYYLSAYRLSRISQWYSAGLRAGWSEVRVTVRAGNFFPHHRVQTGSGAHPASYSMGTKASFPGGKSAGAWSWPLTSSSAEVENAWSYTSNPPIRFHGVVLS
jgi:hypothetical protein